MVTDGPLFELDHASRLPLYVQVEEHLTEAIASGRWGTGDRLPSEQELMAAYGVSRMTLRQAMNSLVDRGLLVRGRGRGTFVRDARMIATSRGVSSFSDELKALGLTPGSTVLSVTTGFASEEVAAALESDPGVEIVTIRRLRTGDGQAIGVQTSHLLQSRVPGIDRLVGGEASLYRILRDRFRITPTEALETFRVGGASAADAELLGLRRGGHVFLVERIARDARGPFELTYSVMRGDRYQIQLVRRDI